MAKRIYEQTVLRWALAIGLILGLPIFGYFSYSNEIGAITITEKSWTDFCNATSWDNPVDIICKINIKFCVNEDTFWYPVNYDPWGRSSAYDFDPAVKEWKFYRSWGKGWRQIDLTKPCYWTWCGAKKNRAYTNLYSVAWREGRCYNIEVRAIKNNSDDNIFWSFGDIQ